MPDFFSNNTNPEAVNRGAGRLMYAAMSASVPTSIGDVINLSTYAAQASNGWYDLGSTKGGIQISFNNSEESIDVDQINGDIDTFVTGNEMSVSTTLAETTLDRLAMAWEGDVVSVNSGPAIPEKQTGFGPFESYTQRRLAVGARNSKSGKLRLFFFHKANRAPQESTIEFNKTGAQQTIPVRFNILPDTSISNVRQRYALAFDQI